MTSPYKAGRSCLRQHLPTKRMAHRMRIEAMSSCSLPFIPAPTFETKPFSALAVQSIQKNTSSSPSTCSATACPPRPAMRQHLPTGETFRWSPFMTMWRVKRNCSKTFLALRSCCSSTDGPWGGARLFNGQPSILNTLSTRCHFALRPAPPPTTASSSRESRPLSRPTPPLWAGFMTPLLRPD